MARRVQICKCTERQIEQGETCRIGRCHNRHRRRRRGTRHPYLRSDGLPINAVPTVDAGVDGRVLDLLDSHPEFDRSAFAWVGSEHMGRRPLLRLDLHPAPLPTALICGSPIQPRWSRRPAFESPPREPNVRARSSFCSASSRASQRVHPARREECGAEDLAAEALRMIDLARAR